MIIEYEGQLYPYDLDDVTVKQALKIEKFMGCSLTEWGKKLQAGDLRARQAVGWLILHQGGDTPIEDTDFKMAKLSEAIEKAYAAEEAKQQQDAGPVPTVAASNGRKRAPAASSPLS